MAGTGEQLAALLLLLVVFSLPAALADRNFIAKTCNNTEHPDKCRALLARDKRSVNATTVVALANIGLDVTSDAARSIAGTMHELSVGKYDGKTEGEALLQCTQVYGNAVEDLDEAREPLNSGKYGDASRLLSSAEDAGDACEGAFSDRGVNSVVSDLDRRMKEQCGVAGDLIDLLGGV
ncbi:hypothetical protein PR202_gb26684 [Eleusine coracana subsp. coracana]|uniref:Pectinesterase inhibitor domain-containing protein n=1 Tax=Eleusine coracana subsp. coracana TaxID=191504 RepID=A0AAV5FSE1_ELECO|nr:hypothetical protein QOZ80_1BG0055510 [Eleusine coracana subsp. coracana]GJN37703.1 hypothetical protein PR202_gb26684 [Eleusine coracana subsp. coracana]